MPGSVKFTSKYADPRKWKKWSLWWTFNVAQINKLNWTTEHTKVPLGNVGLVWESRRKREEAGKGKDGRQGSRAMLDLAKNQLASGGLENRPQLQGNGFNANTDRHETRHRSSVQIRVNVCVRYKTDSVTTYINANTSIQITSGRWMFWWPLQSSESAPSPPSLEHKISERNLPTVIETAFGSVRADWLCDKGLMPKHTKVLF